MTVALSSLRVTADFDASSYTRGMQQKIVADQAGTASSDALGRALAAQDAAAGKVVPGVSRLSRSLVEGYTAGAQFETTIRAIGNAADRGLGLDRVGQLLDATYRKFGQVADATALAGQGYVRIAGLVTELNQHYELQNEILARNVAATRAAAEAQTAQAQINQRLGVGSEAQYAGTAQASAEAFLAEFGGLDGIAKAKAQEAGQAFSQELDARLVAGSAKSARDSASVFSAELDNLDRIGQLKAQQIGQAFGDDLNARLIAGTAKSARDSAAVFQEEMDRLAEIASLKAQQVAQTAQVGINQSFGIGAQPKSAQASASVFQEAFAAQEQMATSAANLRARIDPLGTAQAKLNEELETYAKLAQAGAISQEEAAKAAEFASQNFSLFKNTVTGVGQAGRLTAGEFVNLSYQINDVLTGLALGQPLFMIAAQQGGQVYQVLANSRAASQGFGAAIAAAGRSVVTAFGGVLTSAAGVYAAIAAVVAVSVASVVSWQSAQREIGKALLGIGAASGATVESINKLAEANSSFSTVSIAGAREVAVALAESGKVANDNIGPIVKLTHDFATAMGVDTAGAAKQLGAAFADPIKGAEDLNQRFGFLDDKTRTLIKSLQESGDRQAAVITLTNSLAASISRASDLTTIWGRAWNVFTNAVSDAYTKLGQVLDRAIIGTLPQQLDQLQARAEKLRQQVKSPTLLGVPLGASNYSPLSLGASAAAAHELAEVEAQIKSLQAAAQSASVALAQRSLEIGEALRATLPTVDQFQTLQNRLGQLAKAMQDPALASHLANVDRLPQAYARASEAVASFIDPIQKETQLLQLQVRALDERSPGQRAAIAMEQKRLELAGQAISAEEKARQVQLAGQVAAGGETAQLNIEQRRISLLGQLAQVSDAVRQKEIELRLAHMEGIDVTNAQAEAIKRLAALEADQARLQQQITIGVGSEARIRAVLAQQLQSYIDKKLLDPTNARQMADAQVALAKSFEQMSRQAEIAKAPLEQLKGLEIDSASLRTQLDQTATTSLNSISSNLAQITSGSVTAADGFRNMGQTVVQAIEEMIIKMTIIAPIARALQDTLGGFLPGGGGGGFSLSSLFSFGGGGSKGVASAYGNVFSGGNVVPFRRGGVITQPVIFPMANGGTGLAGEAGDEGILPLRRGSDGRLGVSMYGAGASGGVTVTSPNIAVNVHNYAGSQVSVKDATSDGKGGFGIDVVVDKVSAQNMAKPGSMTNRVMRNTYGNQQRVVRR